mmetsp:Transcript_2007/g.5924  ORF Transcript_2007/g.5924 Transcript_2007/m.5924 type:complete len:237 (-) Transcript_2007:834-1544(-)
MLTWRRAHLSVLHKGASVPKLLRQQIGKRNRSPPMMGPQQTRRLSLLPTPQFSGSSRHQEWRTLLEGRSAKWQGCLILLRKQPHRPLSGRAPWPAASHCTGMPRSCRGAMSPLLPAGSGRPPLLPPAQAPSLGAAGLPSAAERPLSSCLEPASRAAAPRLMGGTTAPLLALLPLSPFLPLHLPVSILSLFLLLLLLLLVLLLPPVAQPLYVQECCPVIAGPPKAASLPSIQRAPAL